jgi:hypothetical protein
MQIRNNRGLESGEVHQGDPDLALDRRQYCDISHTSNGSAP